MREGYFEDLEPLVEELAARAAEGGVLLMGPLMTSETHPEPHVIYVVKDGDGILAGELFTSDDDLAEVQLALSGHREIEFVTHSHELALALDAQQRWPCAEINRVVEKVARHYISTPLGGMQ